MAVTMIQRRHNEGFCTVFRRASRSDGSTRNDGVAVYLFGATESVERVLPSVDEDCRQVPTLCRIFHIQCLTGLRGIDGEGNVPFALNHVFDSEMMNEWLNMLNKRADPLNYFFLPVVTSSFEDVIFTRQYLTVPLVLLLLPLIKTMPSLCSRSSFV